MRTQEQIADIVEATCNAIEIRLKIWGKSKQDQIIAEHCKIHDISEKHIRTVLMIDENSRSSVRLREKME